MYERTEFTRSIQCCTIQYLSNNRYSNDIPHNNDSIQHSSNIRWISAMQQLAQLAGGGFRTTCYNTDHSTPGVHIIQSCVCVSGLLSGSTGVRFFLGVRLSLSQDEGLTSQATAAVE